MSHPPVKVPPLKIQGIKTKLVPFIRGSVSWSPASGVWIEPFMGSGVVGFNIGARRAIMADANPHVVRLYKDIQSFEVTGSRMRDYLEEEGAALLKSGEEHYYRIRDRFNSAPNSYDFIFLNRACFNGVMRFNSKGRFNVPFCRKPERFRGAYVTKIVNQVIAVSSTIQGGDFDFRHQDWKTTLDAAGAGDFVYADPPYAGRHTDYFTSWDDGDAEELAVRLKALDCGFAMSTWLSNKYRVNESVALWFKAYDIRTEAHFYHVGSSESLRNEMVEALVIKPGFGRDYAKKVREPAPEQISLFG